MNPTETGGPARKRRANSEAIEWNEYPRLIPGEYRGYCRVANHYRDPGFRAWRCMLRWDLLSGDMLRVLACVPQWFALGCDDKPRASRRGKYLPEWIRANGGPPARRDRLSPNVFVRRVALVEVGDTDGPIPYSVVRRIISWETGFRGHSVSKSHSQGNPHSSEQESGGSHEALADSSASALAGVEGENTPAHTQGAGEQETANPPKARESLSTTAVSVTAAHSQATDCKRKKGGCCPNVAH